jgi:hypothetical protein
MTKFNDKLEELTNKYTITSMDYPYCSEVPVDTIVKEFSIYLLDQVYETIKHGDEEHMKWLKDKVEELKKEL